MSFLKANSSRLLWVIVFLFLFGGNYSLARKKVDVVLMKNGDKVTGEIKDLERGMLKVSTDYMGTVDIEWERIAKVISPQGFEVEDKKGLVYYGSLMEPQEPDQISVGDATDPKALERDSVVYVTPIGERFWNRLDLNVDLGFRLARANQTTTWDLHTGARYLGNASETNLSFSSQLINQETIKKSTRNVLEFDYNRWLGNRWLATGIVGLNSNDELRLDYRALGGAGVGRNVVQSNRVKFDLIGGFAYSRERFLGDEPRNNSEAVINASFDYFTFGDNETDISTYFTIYPNLQISGRYRTDVMVRFRYEIFRDFTVGFRLFHTYDSKPPSRAANKEDYGFSTTIGFKF